MPELPEVETTVNGIKPWLENKTIKNIHVYNASLRWPIPQHLATNHVSQKITTISRRAKYILIHLQSGHTLILHLGMSGSLSIIPATNNIKPLLKHDHFELEMEDKTRLRLNDPRRFGCVLDSPDYLNHKLLKNLGPEPLSSEFNGTYLKHRALNKSQAVKNFIMDGKIVVGVGNIYASEALFLAGIRPHKPAGKISLAKYNTLASVIKGVLANAIKAGGTTLRNFTNAEGKPGYFSQALSVYARTGLPCVNCGNKILRITIGQRSSFYCSHCQK